MIIVKKSGYLNYKNFKFRCALGKNGIKKKVKEGDFITPKGKYKLIKIYYRPDRIKKINSPLKKIKIKKNMGWCDDVNSKHYNKQIKINDKISHEKLYRKDSLYDILIVLNYNLNPITRGKGSAIFLHVAKKNYSKTQGCIALKKNELLNLVSKIKKNTQIKIG
jgi:L,D-peptidoglycan transpeptidase YkuD (ErfK/YbiS/YcfS/YnhG family)